MDGYRKFEEYPKENQPTTFTEVDPLYAELSKLIGDYEVSTLDNQSGLELHKAIEELIRSKDPHKAFAILKNKE